MGMRWMLFLLAAACGPKPATNDTVALAQCLSSGGTRMYGAFWCPHCAAQKELFGTAFEHVSYVECSNPDRTQAQECVDAAIRAYPTWVFPDASRLEGEQTLAELKARSGC